MSSTIKVILISAGVYVAMGLIFPNGINFGKNE